MKGHDDMCPLSRKDTTHQSWGFVECRCDEYARVRADERAKAHVHNTGTSSPDACCECCYDVPSLERDHLAARRRVKELVDERADLWAKVKALPVAYTVLGETKLDDFNMVFVRDVLALLPEVSG